MKLNFVFIMITTLFVNISNRGNATNSSINTAEPNKLSVDEAAKKQTTIQSVAAFYEVTNACEGSDLQLMAYGKGKYLWIGPNNFTSTERYPIINHVSEKHNGVYQLIVTDENGNQTMASTRVLINKTPELDLWTSNLEVCEGEMLELHAKSDAQGIWTGPSGLKSAQNDIVLAHVTKANEGLYTFTSTNAAGCTKQASYQVKVNAALEKDAKWTVTKDASTQMVKLVANGGSDYEWSGPNGFQSNDKNVNFLLNNVTNGIYNVKITDNKGCFSITPLLVDLKVVATETPANNKSSKIRS